MNNNDNQNLWHFMPLIFKKLPRPGVLLVTGKDSSQKNVMTIGWLQIGILWEKPAVTILVRPSRYSYKLLQDHDEFTLNIMPDVFDKTLSFCGEKSGAYCDKFDECDLHTMNSANVSCPSLRDAEIIIECKILSRIDIDPKKMNDLILARYYLKNDYHQMISASMIKFISNKN